MKKPVDSGDVLEVEVSPYSGIMGSYQLKVERAELIPPRKYKPGDFIDRIVNYPFEVLYLECSMVGRSREMHYYYLLPQPKGDWLNDPINQRSPGFLWASSRMRIVRRHDKRLLQGELFT